MNGRTAFPVFATSALCLALAACGGDSSSPSAPTTIVAAPTPAPCTQSMLLQGSTSLASRFISRDTLNVTTAGRLDVIADWTFAASTIAVYVVQGACSLDQLNARTCNFAIRSESGPKPRKVSASLTPGTYALILGNGATESESLSVQVFLSSATCPSITSASSVDHATLAHTFEGVAKGLR